MTRRKFTYKPFPNPHVRTNGFVLRREIMLGLWTGSFKTKADALRFESGRSGLTSQILKKGLEALVVGADGKAYGVDEWYASRTFRSGDQSNLLIADNRTLEYAASDDAGKRASATRAWGDVVAEPARKRGK